MWASAGRERIKLLTRVGTALLESRAGEGPLATAARGRRGESGGAT